MTKVLVGAFLMVLLVELVLRLGLGLGTPPLYRADPNYEYIYQANQDLNRRGNHVLTNAYSMRSHPLRKDDGLRVLKVGDSVIHGGGQTDHDSLASTRLEIALQKHFAQNIRVLNISAGSWGPDNGLAYLKSQGDFGAKVLLLVYSSHDLYDRMTHYPMVGDDPDYPSTTPVMAMQEVWQRSIAPRIQGKKEYSEDAWNQLIQSQADTNEGWQGLIDFGISRKMDVIVYLHPTQEELKNGEFNANGRYLCEWLRNKPVTFIDGREVSGMDGYRDHIHLNDQGQKYLYKGILPALENAVKRQLTPHQLESGSS
ncbi:MAG: hypothetical protein ACFB10_17880 [Salibacteraceae bacterium]